MAKRQTRISQPWQPMYDPERGTLMKCLNAKCLMVKRDKHCRRAEDGGHLCPVCLSRMKVITRGEFGRMNKDGGG